MNYKILLRLLGIVLLIEAALMLPSVTVSAIFGESLFPFAIAMLILILVALPLLFIKTKDRRMYAKEGFICVGASWILLSVFGAIPFVISGAIPNYIDAFFETVSGFTTTGASVLSEIEALPKGILFWRSFTHWIGGMGVIVFMLAIIPSLGTNTIHIMKAEVPGPEKGKLVPKMRQTALILYGIYFSITILETAALLIAGLPLYDSLVTTFGTVGTGGFSVLNSSIAGYMNPAAEWIVAIFMLICGVNFNLYFFIIIKKFRDIFKNEELRVYLLLCTVSTVLIAVNLINSAEFSSVSETVRASFFQVASIMSTAGFSTVNYELWPQFSKGILLLLTFIGACAGSTAGGFKVSRLIIVLKNLKNEIKKILKPNSVSTVRLNGIAVPEKTAKTATSYFVLYFVLIFASTLLVSFDGHDFMTNFSASVTCINNVGPGFSLVGPHGNFSCFSYFSKIILSFVMLFGRLEIIPMIIMLSPSSWRGALKKSKEV